MNSSIRRAVITLYIDPEAYREESGKTLTNAKLQEIGKQVNGDAATIYGYEGWKAEFVLLPVDAES